MHHIDVRYQSLECLVLPVTRRALELFLIYGTVHHVPLHVVVSFEDFPALGAGKAALVLVLLLEVPPVLLLFGVGFVAHGTGEQRVSCCLFENAEPF